MRSRFRNKKLNFLATRDDLIELNLCASDPLDKLMELVFDYSTLDYTWWHRVLFQDFLNRFQHIVFRAQLFVGTSYKRGLAGNRLSFYHAVSAWDMRFWLTFQELCSPLRRCFALRLDPDVLPICHLMRLSRGKIEPSLSLIWVKPVEFAQASNFVLC